MADASKAGAASGVDSDKDQLKKFWRAIRWGIIVLIIATVIFMTIKHGSSSGGNPSGGGMKKGDSIGPVDLRSGGFKWDALCGPIEIQIFGQEKYTTVPPQARYMQYDNGEIWLLSAQGHKLRQVQASSIRGDFMKIISWSNKENRVTIQTDLH